MPCHIITLGIACPALEPAHTCQNHNLFLQAMFVEIFYFVKFHALRSRASLFIVEFCSRQAQKIADVVHPQRRKLFPRLEMGAWPHSVYSIRRRQSLPLTVPVAVPVPVPVYFAMPQQPPTPQPPSPPPRTETHWGLVDR